MRARNLNRRELLQAAGAAMLAGRALEASPAVMQPDSGDRARWVAMLRRLADPVLDNLAAQTLRARMPVEQAAGADRRPVTHLEAFGRLLAGIGPWLELGADATDEGQSRDRYAALARRAPCASDVRVSPCARAT
jgi:hypothetical protein